MFCFLNQGVKEKLHVKNQFRSSCVTMVSVVLDAQQLTCQRFPLGSSDPNFVQGCIVRCLKKFTSQRNVKTSSTYVGHTIKYTIIPLTRWREPIYFNVF